MRRFGAIAFGLTLVGLMAALPSHLVAYTGEKLAKGAKVSIEQARAIAQQARPGAITDEELEREKGGSGRVVERLHGQHMAMICPYLSNDQTRVLTGAQQSSRRLSSYIHSTSAQTCG